MDDNEALYMIEIKDLVVIGETLEKALSDMGPWVTVLYVDSLEFTVYHDGGDRVVFKGWWDLESETMRFERVPKAES